MGMGLVSKIDFKPILARQEYLPCLSWSENLTHVNKYDNNRDTDLFDAGILAWNILPEFR